MNGGDKSNCTTDCTWCNTEPPRCGDGHIDYELGETCDDGADNGRSPLPSTPPPNHRISTNTFNQAPLSPPAHQPAKSLTPAPAPAQTPPAEPATPTPSSTNAPSQPPASVRPLATTIVPAVQATVQMDLNPRMRDSLD
ncbi:MAG: hypothetical protein CL912_33345 [Deltaproteobacteria bacterium]|nr:hypothetical protein [Deltaproteobacteria bacterium]